MAIAHFVKWCAQSSWRPQQFGCFSATFQGFLIVSTQVPPQGKIEFKEQASYSSGSIQSFYLFVCMDKHVVVSFRNIRPESPIWSIALFLISLQPNSFSMQRPTSRESSIVGTAPLILLAFRKLRKEYGPRVKAIRRGGREEKKLSKWCLDNVWQLVASG